MTIKHTCNDCQCFEPDEDGTEGLCTFKPPTPYPLPARNVMSPNQVDITVMQLEVRMRSTQRCYEGFRPKQ